MKGGTVTIIAKAAADPTVQGAAAITVTGGGVPTVTIQSIIQTFGGTSSAADLSNAKGQLDITLNVEPNGRSSRPSTATITCGAKSKSASQTISDVAPSGAQCVGGSDHAQHQHRRVQRDDGRAGPEQRRLRADGRCRRRARARRRRRTTRRSTLNNTDVVIVKTTNSGTRRRTRTVPSGSRATSPLRRRRFCTAARRSRARTSRCSGADTPTQTGVTLTAGVASADVAVGTTASTTGPNVKGLTLGTSACADQPDGLASSIRRATS